MPTRHMDMAILLVLKTTTILVLKTTTILVPKSTISLVANTTRVLIEAAMEMETTVLWLCQLVGPDVGFTSVEGTLVDSTSLLVLHLPLWPRM